MYRERSAPWAVLLVPALLTTVAYVDPGNFATNSAAGARYGYLLVWVLVAANLMAMLVQYLSAKLGLVTGRSLPELLGHRLPRGRRLAYWVQAEIVAAVTNEAVAAEVEGAGGMTAYVASGQPKAQIEQAVGRINGRFARVGWTPLQFYFRSLPFEEVSAWYAMADVMWITPLRDGLNLVAKEFVAAHGIEGSAGDRKSVV